MRRHGSFVRAVVNERLKTGLGRSTPSPLEELEEAFP
jgi:hypothetical protein